MTNAPRPLRLSERPDFQTEAELRAADPREGGRPHWLRRMPRPLALAAGLLAIIGPGAALFATGESALPEPGRYTDPDMSAAEMAENNFPGSAFYYLDNDTGEAWDTARETEAAADSEAAKPFRIAAKGRDYDRALKCLTDAVYYEAALEPDAGQRAVAQVILNRVRHASYPSTVCGVIYQGSERATGCQFSYSCDGSMARAPARSYRERAEKVAKEALSGSVYAPVGLATHYHTSDISPYWAPSLSFLGTVGAHRFYRFKGNAGSAAAFFKRYAGGEPTPAPHPRRADAVKVAAADPLREQAAYEAKYGAEQNAAETREAALKRQAAEAQRARLSSADMPDAPTAHAAPSYAGLAKARGGEAAYKASRLPQSGSVRSEYAESGSWKTGS